LSVSSPGGGGNPAMSLGVKFDRYQESRSEETAEDMEDTEDDW
jgi:hypothetical protein